MYAEEIRQEGHELASMREVWAQRDDAMEQRDKALADRHTRLLTHLQEQWSCGHPSPAEVGRPVAGPDGSAGHRAADRSDAQSRFQGRAVFGVYLRRPWCNGCTMG